MKTFIILALASTGPVAAAEPTWQPRPAPLNRQRIVVTEPVATLTLTATSTGRVRQLPQPDAVASSTTPLTIELDVPHLHRQVAEAEVAVAEARLAAAAAALDQERASLRAQHFDQQISRDQKNNLVTRLPQFELERDLARLEAKHGRTRLELTQQRLERAVALAASVKAVLAQTQQTVPEGWTVVRRHAVEDTMVQTGQPLLDVADLRELLVSVPLSAAEVANARVQTTDGVEIAIHKRRLETTLLQNAQEPLARLTLIAKDLQQATGRAAGGIRLSVHSQSQGGGWLVPRRLLQARNGGFAVRLETGPRTVDVIEWRDAQAVVDHSDLLPTDTLLSW